MHVASKGLSRAESMQNMIWQERTLLCSRPGDGMETSTIQPSLILSVTLTACSKEGEGRDYVLDADLGCGVGREGAEQVAVGLPIQLDLEQLLDFTADDQEAARLVTRSLLFSDGAGRERREFWARACDRATRENARLRLRLRLRDRDGQQVLQRIRWELLHDGDISDPHRRGYPIAKSEKILLARVEDSDNPSPTELPQRPELKALLLVASPRGAPPIDVNTEVTVAREALSDIKVVVLARSPLADALPTRSALRKNLRDGFPIVYLICHGRLAATGPRLLLEDEQGEIDSMLGDELSLAIHNCEGSRKPLLIMLASCHSAGALEDDASQGDGRGVPAALAPSLARQGVPAVLGMQGAVSLALTRKLFPALLRELNATNGQIDLALARARQEIPDGEPFWAPVLFLRYADGRIWQQGALTQAARSSKTVLAEIQRNRPIFLRAQQQLQDINTYKRIHDDLQRLERPYWQARKMFEEVQATVRLELQRLSVDKVQQAERQRNILRADPQWRNTLDMLSYIKPELRQTLKSYEQPVSDREIQASHRRSQDDLRRAFAALDARKGDENEQFQAVDAVLDLLTRAIKLQTPRANLRMLEEAKRLPLREILAALQDIQSIMKSEQARVAVGALARLSEQIDALQKLRSEFEVLLTLHGAWQEIDDMLRELDDEYRHAIDVFSASRFRPALAEIQERIDPFIAAAREEEWAQMLDESRRQLEQELTQEPPRTTGVLNRYRDYYRTANEHFFELDGQLKSTCERLLDTYKATIDELLALSLGSASNVQ